MQRITDAEFRAIKSKIPRFPTTVQARMTFARDAVDYVTKSISEIEYLREEVDKLRSSRVAPTCECGSDLVRTVCSDCYTVSLKVAEETVEGSEDHLELDDELKRRLAVIRAGDAEEMVEVFDMSFLASFRRDVIALHKIWEGKHGFSSNLNHSINCWTNHAFRALAEGVKRSERFGESEGHDLLDAAQVVIDLMSDPSDPDSVGWSGFRLLDIMLNDHQKPYIPRELRSRFDYVLKVWSLKVSSLTMLRDETAKLVIISETDI